jgi:hypothetical protein
MTEQQVKKKIGNKNWEKFCEWMTGQTIGLNEDGTTDFYECDVEAFMQKLKTGYDRQDDPLAWD